MTPPNRSSHHMLPKNIVPHENNHQQYKAKATNLDDYATKTLPNTTQIRQTTILHTPAHHNNRPTQSPTPNLAPLFLPPTDCNTATHNHPSHKTSEYHISDLLSPTPYSNPAHTKNVPMGIVCQHLITLATPHPPALPCKLWSTNPPPIPFNHCHYHLHNTTVQTTGTTAHCLPSTTTKTPQFHFHLSSPFRTHSWNQTSYLSASTGS